MAAVEPVILITPEGFKANGGNGGGIVIITAGTINTNNKAINADGNPAIECSGLGASGCHEGMGGGGAGGAIILNVNTYTGNLNANTTGGKGADMPVGAYGRLGPGGGGGGGVAWIKTAVKPVNLLTNNAGGINGVNTGFSNDSWGATPGNTGLVLTGLQLPVTSIPFKPNIDSVRIKKTATGCSSFSFEGLGYTNTNPISSWQWFFGDGTMASTQNTSHSYLSQGTFTVKLVITDINGCKDSITTDLMRDCDSIIINDYTPILSFDPCKNSLGVTDASKFNVGDTVLIIQMKGAIIDSTNTVAFGTIKNYRNAGNYEFNYVKAKTGNIIELLNVVERQYDVPIGKVQLVRVPYFQDYTAPSTLTCLPWDGSKGGVLVFNVQNSLTLDKNIDVSGRGFKGGTGKNSGQLVTNCFTNGYIYPSTSTIAAAKGESITTISNNISNGKGALAGAGGGGLDHNSGGGGGGNGGIGGFGGYQLEPCGNSPFDNRGIGGKNIAYSNAANKIFMGSGGGAGHANNPGNQPSSGGNGGGIVIITAQNLQINNSSRIIANGNSAPEYAVTPLEDCHDGMGGGALAEQFY